MKKNKDVEIILLGNEENEKILGLDVNGNYYRRHETEDLETFLGRTTFEHMKKTGVNIFPYFASKKYENVYVMKHGMYLIEKNNSETEKINLKLKKKRVATSVAAAAVGIGMIGSVGCAKLDKNKTELTNTVAATEQTYEEKDLKGKSVEELIDMLNEKSGQKDAINKIVDAQDFFNYSAAPSIKVKKDKDAQLFVTEDEVLSTYIYVNILNEGPTKLSEIFGESEAIWINKAAEGEKPVYEKMTKEQVENAFESMTGVLGNYYKWGVEPTGFSNLFENPEERKFYQDFENLVLEFNRTGSKDVEDEIHELFGKTFGTEQIDPLYEKYPGACALMARTAVPALKENGVVCDKGFANIANIYVNYMGDRINDAMLQMFDDSMQKEGKNDYILNKIYKMQDKTLIGANRNIYNSYKVPSIYDFNCYVCAPCNTNCEEKENCEVKTPCEEVKEEKRPYEPSTNYRIPNKPNKPHKPHEKRDGCDYYKIDPDIKIPKYKDEFKEKTETRTEVEKEHIETTDREKVEEKYTEDEIKEAEKQADEECQKEVEEKNEAENKRAEDIQRGNNDAVNYFLEHGSLGIPDPDASEEYKKAYEKANKDLLEVIKQREEYDKTHPETTTEEIVGTIHYDNDGNVISIENSTNSNNSNNNNSNSNSETTNENNNNNQVVDITTNNENNEQTETNNNPGAGNRIEEIETTYYDNDGNVVSGPNSNSNNTNGSNSSNNSNGNNSDNSSNNNSHNSNKSNNNKSSNKSNSSSSSNSESNSNVNSNSNAGSSSNSESNSNSNSSSSSSSSTNSNSSSSNDSAPQKVKSVESDGEKYEVDTNDTENEKTR